MVGWWGDGKEWISLHVEKLFATVNRVTLAQRRLEHMEWVIRNIKSLWLVLDRTSKVGKVPIYRLLRSFSQVIKHYNKFRIQCAVLIIVFHHKLQHIVICCSILNYKINNYFLLMKIQIIFYDFVIKRSSQKWGAYLFWNKGKKEILFLLMHVFGAIFCTFSL